MQTCQREDYQPLPMHFQLQSWIDHHGELCQQPSLLSRCFKLVTEMSNLTLAGSSQSMFTLIMNGLLDCSMSKWCVAAWICAVTLPFTLVLRSADKGSQVVVILSTPAIVWYIRTFMRINVNQKFSHCSKLWSVSHLEKPHTWFWKMNMLYYNNNNYYYI